MSDRVRDYLPLLALARWEGETLSIPLDAQRHFLGFQGQAVFHLLMPRQVPRAVRAELAILAAFANFCGTGAETLRGMGQTRVTPHDGR